MFKICPLENYQCGQCKKKLKGIRPTRLCERSRMSKRQKTVVRTYGGVLCHVCLRERTVRAFLIEEQKIVKALKSQREMMVKPAKPVKAVEKKQSKTAGAAKRTSKSATKNPAQKSTGKTKKKLTYQTKPMQITNKTNKQTNILRVSGDLQKSMKDMLLYHKHHELFPALGATVHLVKLKKDRKEKPQKFAKFPFQYEQVFASTERVKAIYIRFRKIFSVWLRLSHPKFQAFPHPAILILLLFHIQDKTSKIKVQIQHLATITSSQATANLAGVFRCCN
uniref:Large ribosomal subunit protein eL34 n=1 Tax=Glossina pallidipes TaxID=7398 RepID=A0A1A9ZDC4_GLOPL